MMTKHERTHLHRGSSVVLCVTPKYWEISLYSYLDAFEAWRPTLEDSSLDLPREAPLNETSWSSLAFCKAPLEELREATMNGALQNTLEKFHRDSPRELPKAP